MINTKHMKNMVIICLVTILVFSTSALPISISNTSIEKSEPQILNNVVCGDIDGNGDIEINDIVYLVNFMFHEGPAPPIMCQCDVDGNGIGPDIADLIYLVDYMFQGGPPPVETCCEPQGYWESIGPFEGGGPDIVECDPFNSNIIYVGNNGGSGLVEGLFRSIDAGETWEILKGGKVYSLAIDPTDSNILYAGVHNLLYKSLDGGDSWTILESDDPYFDVVMFTSIAIYPEDPSIVYACGSDFLYGSFLYVSYDAGSNWACLLDNFENPGIFRIIVDLWDPRIIYGAVNGLGIYKSTDAGNTWEWKNTGLTNLNIYEMEQGIVFDESYVIYVSTLNNGIFFTENYAETWHPRNNGLSSLQVSSLATMKDDGYKIYAGTIDGIFRSIDGGLNWLSLSDLPAYTTAGGSANRWVVGLAVDPFDWDTVYASCYDIVYKSQNAGDTWEFIGLPIAMVTTLEADPNNPETIYCGGRYGSLFYKSINNGLDWRRWVPPEPSPYDTTVIRVHPQDSNVIYLGGYNIGSGFYKSMDAGETWVEMNEGLYDMKDRCIEDLAIDPNNAEMLYLGTLNGVFKSDTGGERWFDTGLTIYSIHVMTIETHPIESDIIYAGTYNNGLHKSVNGGADWIELDTGLDEEVYMDIVIDPINPETVYVATRDNGILKSTDAGHTWAIINNGLGVTPPAIRALLIYNPTPTSTEIYAGTSGGYIFKSTNDGMQWNQLTTEGILIRLSISCLEYTISPENGFTLFAGTYGGGVYCYIEEQ